MATTVLLGILVALLALLCWYAADRDARGTFAATKVGTLAALIALAWRLGAPEAAGGVALLVGLALSLVGDAALVRRDSTAFVVGLGAFLLAHLAYIAAFASRWLHVGGLVIALALALPFALLSAPRVWRGAVAAQGAALGHAVTAYVAVLLAMALAAGATGTVLVLLGGVAFVLSDTVLALDRFDRPRPRAALAVLSLYHLAQVLLVLGMLLGAADGSGGLALVR